MKTNNHKAGTMTESANVKSENESKPADQKRESAATVAKRIEKRAKPADQFEYEDADYAQEIFDKLDNEEFTLKQGDKTVIQKL